MEELINKKLFFEYLRTEFLGRNIEELDRVGSTIDYIAENNPPVGSLILAHLQENGRGRSGRVWIANEDSLTFSILLPIVEPHMLMPLNIIMGYAICDGISLYANAKLKWPNDCVIDNKKVCGMLLEVPFVGGKVSKVILGVGINLFNKSFYSPYDPDLAEKATSIFLNTDKEIKKELLLAEIMNRMEELFTTYISGKLDIVNTWENYSANIGKEIKFHRAGSVLNCFEKGINEIGEIVVEHDNIIENINIGDVGYDFSR